MCKKLICFVIVLSFVVPAMSATRIFDNDNADGLWATAANWDPCDMRPGLTEDVNIYAPFAVTSNDPNHGCANLWLSDGSTLDITGGVMTCTASFKGNGDLNMSGDAVLNAGGWPAHGMDPNYTTTIAMSGDSLYIHESVSRWATGNNAVVNATLSGNAEYSQLHRLELAYAPDSTVDITLNDDAILGRMRPTPGGRIFMGGNAGGSNQVCNITMNDNSTVYTDHMFVGHDIGATTCLTMNDNSYLRCMSGPTLVHLLVGFAGANQNATLNQNGGLIEVSHSVIIPGWAPPSTAGTYNLFDGVCNTGMTGAGGLMMAANGLLNVKKGIMTMPGDQRMTIAPYVGLGYVKAYYNDYEVRAKLLITYDAGTNKTTISAYRPNLDQAWGEVPVDVTGKFDGASRNTAAITWQPGDGATAHEVYFGAVKADVAAETIANTYGYYRGTKAFGVESYVPGNDVYLGLGDTWYWRVDEKQTTGPDVKGDVWELNVNNYMILDDMEAYDANDAAPVAIGSVWTVTNGTLGVGYTYLAVDDSSMEVVGNAGGVTTVTRTVPVADLTAANQVNHLRIYFKGATSNTAQQLSVTLEDNQTTPVSFTVIRPDGSANDIIDSRLDPWKEWAIDLTDFTGVDVTDVDTITISCGNNTNKTYIDDVVVYPTACIAAKARLIGDVDGDCRPTLADFAILAYEFLEIGITTVADDMESYADTTALRVNYYPDLLDAPVGSVITLLTAGAFEGSQACEVDYDMWSDTVGATNFSWTMMDLPDIDLSTGIYKELRLRKRTYVGNDIAAGVWVKLFNDNIGGGSSTDVAAHHQISNMDASPGAWEDVRVMFSGLWWYGSDAANPNPLLDRNHGFNSMADLDNVVGIYVDSWSAASSRGTYDIDYIRWMTPMPRADFESTPDGDCDTDDLKTMGANWLQLELFP